MWYFNRMENEKPFDRKAEYFPALDAIREIADAQRKWNFRNRLGSEVAGVLLAITPKFIMDNPEMFEIPDGMNAHNIRNQVAHGAGENREFLRDVVHGLAQANFERDKILFSFLREAEDPDFAELLGYAFMALDGQDFNVRRHPTLLYRAFIANVPRIIQYGGKSDGESITEPWIADLMSELVGIEDGDKVYDNACGMGILASIATVSTGANAYIQDVYFQSAAVARILMLMIGKPESVVSVGDSMLDPSIGGYNGPFDKFLIDAPFGIRTTQFRELPGYTEDKGPEWGQKFNTDWVNDQWVFIRQAFKVLSEHGTGAALVPLSMLNRDGRQYRDTRAEMVDSSLISAVIELPTGSRSFTGIKYAIVLFDRNKAHEDVYFLDLSAKGAEQYLMRNNGKPDLRWGDSEKVADVVRSREEIEGTSRIVSIAEISRNDYRLSIGNYIQVTTNREEALREGAAAWERREELKKEYLMADKELEDLLSSYNAYLNHNTEEDN